MQERGTRRRPRKARQRRSAIDRGRFRYLGSRRKMKQDRSRPPKDDCRRIGPVALREGNWLLVNCSIGTEPMRPEVMEKRLGQFNHPAAKLSRPTQLTNCPIDQKPTGAG